MNESKTPDGVARNDQRGKDGPNDSPKISGVILDYGLVLVRSPTKAEFERMATMFHVPFEQFFELWETSRNPYDRGDITADEYWHGLAMRTNTTLDAAQISTLREIEVEIWVHPIPEMIDWIGQLRRGGIKTAVLSNMPLDLAAWVRKNFSWMDNFTFKTLSAEVRSIKPEPAIYLHTLRGLGVEANEALFVDDREANIRAAQAMGIHGIQFSSVGKFRDDLEAIDFPILPGIRRDAQKDASSDSEESPEKSSEESSPESPARGAEKEIKFQL